MSIKTRHPGIYEPWICPHGCEPQTWLSTADVMRLAEACGAKAGEARSMDPDVDRFCLELQARGYDVHSYRLSQDGQHLEFTAQKREEE